MRFGPKPITAPYLVSHADFVSCSLEAYVEKYDMLSCLKDGGTFLLNTVRSAKELEAHLPNTFKNNLLKNMPNSILLMRFILQEKLVLVIEQIQFYNPLSLN